MNSLSIDPGYIWKGNWRFFDENTLRTCDKRKPKDEPLQNVMEEGITFEEFLYLANVMVHRSFHFLLQIQHLHNFVQLSLLLVHVV